jgi:branched-chain amino acid transport system ATP-binding protein
VTRQSAFERARKGLSRSFQITELCPDFSVLENVMLSLLLVSGRAFGAWSNPRRDAGLQAQAVRWLDEVGLAGAPRFMCAIWRMAKNASSS